MYFTLFDALLGVVFDVGNLGFTIIIYLNEYCLFSIDSNYISFIIAILIMKGDLWSIIHYMYSFAVRCCYHLQSILSRYLNM